KSVASTDHPSQPTTQSVSSQFSVGPAGAMSAPEQGSAPVSDLRRDQERRAAWDGSPPRVLLVEDEEEVRVPLRELLEDMGIEVAGEAGDGEEAIELAGRLQPEVVLMDLRLPKMD